jgi:hypothetical protein
MDLLGSEFQSCPGKYPAGITAAEPSRNTASTSVSSTPALAEDSGFVASAHFSAACYAVFPPKKQHFHSAQNITELVKTP